MATTQTSLASKIVQVMKAVDSIPKRGHNAAQNYDYAMDFDISDACRQAMVKVNIAAFPRVTSHTVREITTTKGNVLNINTVTMEFTIKDGDSGEEITIATVGEGMDSGDKGCYKAMTGATKYALLKLFQIPTGDDPEDDKGEQPMQRMATNRPAQNQISPKSPSPQTSASHGDGLKFPFNGPNKDKLITDPTVSAGSLLGWYNSNAKQLADESKKQYHASSERKNVAIYQELHSRLLRELAAANIAKPTLDAYVYKTYNEDGMSAATIVDLLNKFSDPDGVLVAELMFNAEGGESA